MASASNPPSSVSLHTASSVGGAAEDEKSELPKYTNRLVHEQSPYLLQHAHNPVKWFPWGPEAFETAKRENKPIFLSVGYSTCHWCHVMERESFESEEIAEVMNELFVNIKVDREERPDVDRVYMGFVEALEGSGGWPMSVFLTPDLHPFFGGTYFPPRDQYGRPGFKTVLQRISASWQKSPERAAESAAAVLADLRRSLTGDEPSDSKDIVTPESASVAATKCFRQLKSRFDEEFGGFASGEAPKFPRSVEFSFLFHLHSANCGRAETGAMATEALQMAVKTLQGIANGGMRDHIGGGFHRYSVDRYWHVPHFEKMLYDNAQLTMAFLDAYLITKDPAMRAVAEDTLAYIARDMTHPQGGIFSAEDADSKDPRSGKKEEGAFYIWTEAELDNVLGRGSALTEVFKWMFYVKREGNCDLSPRSDPHRQFVGRNVLIKRHSAEEAAEHFGMEAGEVEAEIKKCRDLLFAERAKRPRPSLDDKVVTGLNGLMMSAFSKAHLAIAIGSGAGGTAYLERAKAIAEFVRRNLTRSDGTLIRSFRTGPSATDAFCDDYAFFIAGLLDLYEASMDSAYLAWALQLQHKQNTLFGDKLGGYFDTTNSDKSILVRTKNSYDGSEPSPNSVSVMNLLRLGQLAGDQSLTGMASDALRAFALRLQQVPLSVPLMVVGLSVAASGLRSVVLSLNSAELAKEALSQLRKILFSRFDAGRTVAVLDSGPQFDRLSAINRFYESMKPQEGGPTCQAFVCQHFTCSRPVVTAAELETLLNQRK